MVRAAVDPDARPWVYAILEVSGTTTIGHLDATCKALAGERVFVPRRLQPDVDRDSWPCARCVSVEQLAAWDPDWPPRFPPEEILVPAEKTLESGPGVADTTGVGGCTPGNPHQEDTTMARSTSTYGRKPAPIQTAILARNGLCPTHRTPILSDGECWECGTVPAAPDFASLKAAFASAIADGIDGAASLRQALLTAYRADASQITPATVASALEMLTTMRQNQTPAPAPKPAPKPASGTPTVATGHYAVRSATGNNDLDFYLVKNVTEGKWAGRTFVEQVVGGHENFPVRGAAGVAVLHRIVEAGAIEAGRLYGQEIGRCYVCHRTLTDEASRAAGIGPDCASREG